jgi:DNA-3-methyladenine glycosylase I
MTKRCPWLNLSNPSYVKYHDEEWGREVHEDQKLFEMLILEGAQAGLSWETVLMKREEYRKVFYNFDIKKCSQLKDTYLEKALLNPGIIRHRLKVYSVRQNALVALQIQKEFGSLDKFLWSYIQERKKNRPKNLKSYPTRNMISDQLSKDLKKRGMKFVGTTIMYAFMQAVGMVDDHAHTCFLS